MIELFDNWVILVGDMDYCLARKAGIRKDKKTGEEIQQFSRYGYYGSIPGALRRLTRELSLDALRGRETTLNEAVRVIKESNARVEQLLERLEDDRK